MSRISILIPVFNEDIRALAKDLLREINEGNQDIEVLFGDDASIKEEVTVLNREFIESQTPFKYILRKTNLGYCQNRNELALNSTGRHLLFLDADIRIENHAFIKNWVKNLKADAIICGGNYYQKEKPNIDTQILKWRYGKEREESSLGFRQRHPHLKFWASNFMTPKDLFLKYPFDHKSKKYGYNDTVYAYQLMKEGIQIEHINNPVLNTGLLENEVFLNRAKEAVANLLFYENQDYIESDFKTYIRLLSIYYQLKKLGLAKISRLKLKFFKGFLLSNLHSSNPKLIYLDLLKLYYLLELKRL